MIAPAKGKGQIEVKGVKGNSARPEKAKGLKRLKLAQIDIYGDIWCSPGTGRQRQAYADKIFQYKKAVPE